MTFQITDIPRLLPELMLMLLALLVVGSDVLERWGSDEQAQLERGKAASQLTAIGLGLVFVVGLVQSRFLFIIPEPGTNALLNIFINLGRNLQAGGPGGVPIMGAFATDQLTMIGRLIFIGAALVVTLISFDERFESPAEFYALLLFATAGMCVMAGASELILAYIALELSSIALYVLAGYLREDRRSAEAGMKYFLFGALSSGLLLYGMSLAYGFTASEANKIGATVFTTTFRQIAEAGIGEAAQTPLLTLAIIFIIAGLGYKITAVPFHSWAPDVYQGAPAIVTPLIATASKTAGFLMLYRLLTDAFPDAIGAVALERLSGWSGMLAVIALLTLIFGNLAALPQTNARRLLAYSSIGHAGFILLSLLLASSVNLPDQTLSTSALLYYLVAYVVTSLVAFGTLAVITQALGSDELDDLRGLWRRNTGLAILFSISIASLAGIPPLAGFWAKLLVFIAGYRAGAFWLVGIGLLMTVVSLYFYLRLLRTLWTGAPASDEPVVLSRSAGATLGVVTLLIVILGIVPGPLWALFEQVTQVVAAGL